MPQWSPSVYECTPVWGIRLLLLVPPPPENIPTSRPLHVFPSSPKSVWPPDGRIPPGYPRFTPSPPNFYCCKAALIVPLPFTSPHGHAPLILYFSTPTISSPTVSALYSSSGTLPSNCYFCTHSFSQGRGRPPMEIGDRD